MRKLFLLAVLVVCAMPAFAQSTCLLTYQTETIAPFHVGQPGNFQLVGVSGTEPYTFEIIQGELPAGLKLHKNGKITGVAQAEAENIVYIRLSDAAGCNLTQAFYVFVFP